MSAPLDKRDRTIPIRRHGAFSLVELLVGISVLGVLALLAIPSISNLTGKVSRTKAKQNALSSANVSGGLSAAGVAHVLPESLGGAEATVRLLRRGLTVPQGPLAGSYFGVPNLTEDEVAPTSVYLEIVMDTTLLRMVYNDDPVTP